MNVIGSVMKDITYDRNTLSVIFGQRNGSKAYGIVALAFFKSRVQHFLEI
jgi:1,4-dihydroxy-2-naphthoate octaprenyltransferase